MEYGLSGFTLGSGTITSTTTATYSMSGLSDNTSYDVCMYRRIVVVGM